MDFSPIEKQQQQATGFVTGALDAFTKITAEVQYNDAVLKYQDASNQFVQRLYDVNNPDYISDPTEYLSAYQQMHKDIFSEANAGFISLDAQRRFNAQFQDSYSTGLKDILVMASNKQVQNVQDQISLAGQKAEEYKDVGFIESMRPSAVKILGKARADLLIEGKKTQAITNIVGDSYAQYLGSLKTPTEIAFASEKMQKSINVADKMMYMNGKIYVGKTADGALVPLDGNATPDDIEPLTTEDIRAAKGSEFGLTTDEKNSMLSKVRQEANGILSTRSQQNENVTQDFGQWIKNAHPGDVENDGFVPDSKAKKLMAEYEASHPGQRLDPSFSARYFRGQKDTPEYFSDPVANNLSYEALHAEKGGASAVDLGDRIYNWYLGDPGSRYQMMQKMMTQVPGIADENNVRGRWWNRITDAEKDLQKSMDYIAGKSNYNVESYIKDPGYVNAQKKLNALTEMKGSLSWSSSYGGKIGFSGDLRDGAGKVLDEAAYDKLMSSTFNATLNSSPGKLIPSGTGTSNVGQLPQSSSGPDLMNNYVSNYQLKVQSYGPKDKVWATSQEAIKNPGVAPPVARDEKGNLVGEGAGAYALWQVNAAAGMSVGVLTQTKGKAELVPIGKPMTNTEVTAKVGAPVPPGQVRGTVYEFQVPGKGKVYLSPNIEENLNTAGKVKVLNTFMKTPSGNAWIPIQIPDSVAKDPGGMSGNGGVAAFMIDYMKKFGSQF